MDRLAVEQGVFKRYRLGVNRAAQDAQWNLVVAVEYYADQDYADIAEAFEAIRSAHVTRLVDGKGFRELGTAVRSERPSFTEP